MLSHVEIPSRVKVVDTKKLVDVNLEQMILESDTGPIALRLRQKSKHLSSDLANIFFYVLLHALNGKRKVSTVAGWANEFELFTRTAVEINKNPIGLLTFAMFNRYVVNKHASQIKQLRSTILYWIKLRKPGIEAALEDYLVTSKAPKPRHTYEIQSLVEKERPFSLQQIRSILGKIDDLYIEGVLDSQDNLLWRLIICEGLRPSQLRLLQFRDIEAAETSPNSRRTNLWVPIVKQKNTAARDYMMLAKMPESVSSAVHEHVLVVKNLLNSAPSGQLPLFSITTRNGCPTVQTKAISIQNRIQRTRKILAARIPELDAYDFFTRRFKHTKLTHLAILGAPVEVLARSGYQTSTVSLRHYTNLSEEAFKEYEDRLAVQHDYLSSAFKGIVIQQQNATHLDSEHIIFSPTLERNLGSCAAVPCNVFAPIGCYDCSRFEAFVDGEHEAVLNFLKEKRSTAEKMGLPADAVSRDDHLIKAVQSVLAQIKNLA